MKQRILIIGSNGLLGQKLIELFNNDYEVIAISRGKNISQYDNSITYFDIDVTNFEKLNTAILKIKPDFVVNAVAMTDVDGCEEQKEKCDKINVHAVSQMIKCCEKLNAHLVHISTDFIFDGKDGPYSENDIPNPIGYYGLSKLKSELLFKDTNIKWTILRTIIIYGVLKNLKRNNIVLWGREALKNGKSINIIDDQFRSPTLAEDLAYACKLVIEKRATGIFNISGKDFMSIFEMVERMADFYNCDKSLINKISTNTLNQKAKRPPKTGFILTKAVEELGYEPHSFEDGLAIIESQIEKLNQ